jgi:uncharacterized protein YaiI (UPF0178 family)
MGLATFTAQVSLNMQIWVDADACPVVIKEILYRAAIRTEITTTLVANQFLRTPPSKYIKTLLVMSGFDVADNRIVQECHVGDLVITADIPLAAQVVEKGGIALNPRGELYTVANIKERLAMRDLMETLRSNGVEVKNQASFNHADKQAFASALDSFIAKYHKK